MTFVIQYLWAPITTPGQISITNAHMVYLETAVDWEIPGKPCPVMQHISLWPLKFWILGLLPQNIENIM